MYAPFYIMAISKEDDIDAIWNGGFNYLFSKQIFNILEMIDNEVVRSYCDFGLQISRDHLVKEKIALLTILNRAGNIANIPKLTKYEEAWGIVSGYMHEAMETESKFYFDKLKADGKMPTAYNCHLESVMSVILNTIYNDKMPFF